MSELEWHVPQRPMGLWSIYRSSLWLCAHTAARGLTAAIVILLPLFYLFGSSAQSFFVSAARVIDQQIAINATASPEVFASVMTRVAGHSLPVVILMFAILVATVVIQVMTAVDSWDRALAVDRTFGAWLARAARRPLATSLMQIAIILVLSAGGFVFAVALSAIVDSAQTGQVLSMMLIAVLVAIVYVAIVTLFRMHEIIADDRGPWRSLWSSASLVRGHWWKVARTLIIPLAVLLVISEIIARVLPGGTTRMATIDPDMSDLKTLAAAYHELATVFTPSRAVILGALWAFAQFYVTNLLTAMYVDLRARRGDFDYE